MGFDVIIRFARALLKSAIDASGGDGGGGDDVISTAVLSLGANGVGESLLLFEATKLWIECEFGTFPTFSRSFSATLMSLFKSKLLAGVFFSGSSISFLFSRDVSSFSISIPGEVLVCNITSSLSLSSAFVSVSDTSPHTSGSASISDLTSSEVSCSSFEPG